MVKLCFWYTILAQWNGFVPFLIYLFIRKEISSIYSRNNVLLHMITFSVYSVGMHVGCREIEGESSLNLK